MREARFVVDQSTSSKQYIEFERRLDKLCGAMEIVFRYFYAKKASAAQAATAAIGALDKSALQQFCTKLNQFATRDSMRKINRAVLAALDDEIAQAGYSTCAQDRLNASRRYFADNLAEFERNMSLSSEAEIREAAKALLMYVITYRNCRFHAVAATSGNIVGYELLQPLADATEELVMLTAMSVPQLKNWEQVAYEGR